MTGLRVISSPRSGVASGTKPATGEIVALSLVLRPSAVWHWRWTRGDGTSVWTSRSIDRLSFRVIEFVGTIGRQVGCATDSVDFRRVRGSLAGSPAVARSMVFQVVLVTGSGRPSL